MREGVLPSSEWGKDSGGVGEEIRQGALWMDEEKGGDSETRVRKRGLHSRRGEGGGVGEEVRRRACVKEAWIQNGRRDIDIRVRK